MKTPAEKALYTAKWAKIMAKWLITSTTVKSKWHIVSFEGSKGGESVGIVDLLAIRRDFITSNSKIKKGDLFEIILIQVKGGNAKMPTQKDMKRLEEVKKYYKARAILLVEWKIKESKKVSELKRGQWKVIENLNSIFS